MSAFDGDTGVAMAWSRDERRRAYVAKARAEVGGLVERGVRMSGNAFSSVLFLKGDLDAAERDGGAVLAGEDGRALRASLEALGYAPEDWAALATVADAAGADDPAPLDPGLLRLSVTTLDPATVVACDERAADALRNAYADELSRLPEFSAAMLAPGVVAMVLGMRLLNLGGFEAALSDPGQKQVMWARLKRIPPLGEPF